MHSHDYKQITLADILHPCPTHLAPHPCPTHFGAREESHTMPALHIPQPTRSVTAACGEVVAVGVKPDHLRAGQGVGQRVRRHKDLQKENSRTSTAELWPAKTLIG